MSLNSINMAIVAGVLLLTLFLAYQVGRGFSSSSAPEVKAPPKTHEFDDIPTNKAVVNAPPQPPKGERRGTRGPGSSTQSPPAPGGSGNRAALAAKAIDIPPAPPTTDVPVPPAPAVPGQRIAGLTYVVLESFKREDKSEAEQIQQWLKAKFNMDTTVEPSGDRWELVSSQGYDYNKDSQKCDEFRNIVKEYGKQYKAEFKTKARYDMRSPGLKKQK